jgi:hypothetical protein
LKTPGKDYAPLYAALKNQGAWWHYLSSTWLVSTTKNAQQVYNELGQHLTTKDFILIVPIGGVYWGYLPKEAWDWIKIHKASL